MNHRTPLFDALTRHSELDRVPLHTPGHKGCAPVLEKLRLCHDLTELPDTDSLYEASGVIAEAESLASELYGSDRTVFSAGGCSLAIQTMLRCACCEGDRIIMDRGSHRMAVTTAALLGLEPIWLSAEQVGTDGLLPLPSAEDVRRLLEIHPDSAAVYLTSPDYMGRLCDISGISAVCRAHGIPLLVDNAHGSHLIAFDGMHPLSQGASMTACSAHKTLPVLTGGAFLSSAVPALSAKMKGAMSLFGSTSPSYLIMASLDLCRAWLEDEGAPMLRRTAELCEDIRMAARNAGFGLPQGACDPMRITLLTRPVGMSGTAAAELLRQYGFEPEYADDACVVMLPSPFISDRQMAELRDAVVRLGREAAETAAAWSADEKPSISQVLEAALTARQAMPLRKAALAESETVRTCCAVGRISAAAVCPCPPGVPVVMPGERISSECARLLLALGVEQMDCVKESNA